jgi:hypothetical protein
MNSYKRRAYLTEPKTNKSEVLAAVASGERVSPEEPELGRQSTGGDVMHAHTSRF